MTATGDGDDNEEEEEEETPPPAAAGSDDIARFEIGDEVEVKRDSWFRATWYEAVVVFPLSRHRRYSVVYSALRDADDPAFPLREAVPASRIRPRPPRGAAAADIPRIGSVVEVFHNDGWRAAVVESTVAARGREGFAVKLMGSSDTVELRAAEVRPFLRWIGGVWLVQQSSDQEKRKKPGRTRSSAGKKISVAEPGMSPSSSSPVVTESSPSSLDMNLSQVLPAAEAVLREQRSPSSIVGGNQERQGPVLQREDDIVLTRLVNNNNGEHSINSCVVNTTKAGDDGLLKDHSTEQSQNKGKLKKSLQLRRKNPLHTCVTRSSTRKRKASVEPGMSSSPRTPMFSSTDDGCGSSANPDHDGKEERSHACLIGSSATPRGSAVDEAAANEMPSHSEAMVSSAGSFNLKFCRGSLPEELLHGISGLGEELSSSKNERLSNALDISTHLTLSTSVEQEKQERDRNVKHGLQRVEGEVQEEASVGTNQPSSKKNDREQSPKACIINTTEGEHSAQQTPINMVSSPCQDPSVSRAGCDLVATHGFAISPSPSDVELLIEAAPEAECLQCIAPDDQTPLLPFVKCSPMWEAVDSLEPLRAIPQMPHFSPLKQYNYEFREGMAVGLMMTFSKLATNARNLRLHNPDREFESILDAFPSLEANGFDVRCVRSRVEALMEVRSHHVRTKTQMAGLEQKIIAQKSEKDKLETMLADLDKEMAEAERAVLRLEEAKSQLLQEAVSMGSEIAGKRVEMEAAAEAFLIARKQFHCLRGAPW